MGAEKEQQGQKPQPRANGNTITTAQFLSWKRQKDADASARKAEVARKRAEEIAAGTVHMNGRELFLHEPWVFDNSRNSARKKVVVNFGGNKKVAWTHEKLSA